MQLFVKSTKDIWKLLSGPLRGYLIIEKSQVIIWNEGSALGSNIFFFFFLIKFLLFFSMCSLVCSYCLYVQRLTLPMFLDRGTTSVFGSE